MPVDIQTFLEVLRLLCDNQKVYVSVKESGKGAAIAGAGAFLGGLIGGPTGIFLGGTLGSGLGAYMASAKCVPVAKIIGEMSDDKKRELFDRCKELVTQLDWSDAVIVTSLIVQDHVLNAALLDRLGVFLEDQFKLRIEHHD